MAVDNLYLKNKKSLAFVVEDANVAKYIDITKGYYEISYYPVEASVSLTTSDNRTKSLSEGSGAVLVISDDPLSIVTDTANTEILMTTTEIVPSVVESFTLEVVSTTSTYTGTGSARLVLIGGGQAGGNPSRQPNQAIGGPGGAGGKVLTTGKISLPGSLPVTIGAGGVASSGAGGNTVVGTYTSANGASVSGGGGGAGWPEITAGTPGSPSSSIINPTGVAPLLSPPVSFDGGVGSPGGSNDNPRPGGSGGRIAAGGGGGGGNRQGPNPLWANAGGGGGGGGGVPGSNGGTGTPSAVGTGGAGGQGILWILKY